MTKEAEQLDYTDAMVSFISIMEQFGARKVLFDMQNYYPDHFQEFKSQVNRFPEKPVAALLRK